MEFSDEVSQGLGYLANPSYISDDNFKKLVNSCLALLSSEQNVEKVSSICPEKSDVIKQIYASLLTFTVEVIRNKAEGEIQNFMRKQNFRNDRIEYYLKALSLNKDNIVKSLENSNSTWPCIVDADWRLDYIVKTNMQSHMKGPLYYIVLTTEKNGKLDYLKFTCNLHQLQDLSTKLKEIAIRIEMTEIWNLWDVKPPPVCSVMTKLHFKEIKNLSEVAYDALKTLRNLNYFDKEAALLSRFLYKHRRIFRHDKGIQNLVKVNQCLKRYLKLNMTEVIFTFKHSLPFNCSTMSTHAYLPTRQMLKWVLLRLQAFSQIFARVIELTKATGAYIYKKLSLGWSLNLSFLAFSITARILVTSKYLVAKSIEWYSSFYKSMQFLEETSDFLPDHQFPVDLKLWLGQVDLTPLKKKTFIDNIFDFIDLEDEEEKDEGHEMEIMSEAFLKTLFKPKISEADSDFEEIQVQNNGDSKKDVKRPVQTSVCEDLGVPVKNEEDGSVRSRKRMRKGNEGQRIKSLKRVKKNSSYLRKIIYK